MSAQHIIISFQISFNFLLLLLVEDRPQVKSGWGTGATVNANSNIGMNVKSNAAAYWDNKTTELIIPEVEADDN